MTSLSMTSPTCFTRFLEPAIRKIPTTSRPAKIMTSQRADVINHLTMLSDIITTLLNHIRSLRHCRRKQRCFFLFQLTSVISSCHWQGKSLQKLGLAWINCLYWIWSNTTLSIKHHDVISASCSKSKVL